MRWLRIMAVAANVIFMWPGTAASIPTGFTRDTRMDGLYPRGWANGVDPGGTGGQATHTHTVPDHTHTQNSHTHNFSAGNSSGNVNIDSTTFNDTGASDPHTHGSKASASATATNQNATITLDGSSNDPPFFDVIFIKSSGTNDIPNNTLGLWDASTLPSQWNLADGVSGRPDLRNRFPRGAAGSGDGGGTGGTSNSHTHSNTAHNHTQNAHNHAATNTTALTIGIDFFSAVGTGAAQVGHLHSVSFGNTTATNNSASITMSSEDAQPPFKKLQIIQNNSGVDNTPTNIIGFWLESLASTPTDWFLCDGTGGRPDARDNFLKGATGSGEVGATGGGSSHSHTANAHTHTQSSHNHTGTGGTASLRVDSLLSEIGGTIASGSHTHTWTVTNTVATNQNTTVTINSNTSETNFPPYKRIAFIRFEGAPAVAALPVYRKLRVYR